MTNQEIIERIELVRLQEMLGQAQDLRQTIATLKHQARDLRDRAKSTLKQMPGADISVTAAGEKVIAEAEIVLAGWE